MNTNPDQILTDLLQSEGWTFIGQGYYIRGNEIGRWVFEGPLQIFMPETLH